MCFSFVGAHFIVNPVATQATIRYSSDDTLKTDGLHRERAEIGTDGLHPERADIGTVGHI